MTQVYNPKLHDPNHYPELYGQIAGIIIAVCILIIMIIFVEWNSWGYALATIATVGFCMLGYIIGSRIVSDITKNIMHNKRIKKIQSIKNN